MTGSKAWDWANVPLGSWNKASDEFLPTALRWKQSGKETVLDVGCGRGRLSLFLADMGFTVTSVDLSPDGIAQLRAEAVRRGLQDRIATMVCDMLDLPFAAGSFDCVLAFHSIYHATYDGLKKVIADVGNVLKPMGQAYLTFNSKSSPAYREVSNEVIDDFTVVKTEGIEKGIPHTFLDHDDVIVLLNGFSIRKIQQIQDYYQGGTGFHFYVEAEKKG